MKDLKKSLKIIGKSFKKIKIFKNKYFLYFIVFISFVNILGYISLKNYAAVFVFGLVGFFTTLISKNMSIVLTITIIITALITPLIYGVKEGMDKLKNGNDSIKKQINNIETKDNDNNDNNISDEMEIAKNNTVNTHDNDNDNEVKNTESLDTLNKGMKGGSKKGGSHIDLASTLEESYDNLNSMLGTDGINKLTEDTKNLMDQQSKLYKNMEAMTPLVGSAKKMLESFDMSKFNDLLGSAGSLGLGIGNKK